MFTNFEIMTRSSDPSIYFFFEETVTLRDRTRLKGFIRTLFKKEGRKLESLNYVFCSDERLLEINRQYLQHNYYTDIITFEMSPAGQPVVGDIYISIDRVRDNARIEKESLTRELHRVIFHGALHLCGYGDKSAAQEKQMRKKEEQWLNLYFKS